MKGRITANQGESRYTIAVDADTALLQILIGEKEKLKESIIQVLYGTGGSSGLYAQEREYEEAYNEALQVVYEFTDLLNVERAEVTVQSCLTSRLNACDAAKSDALQSCRDDAVACRNGCDGDLDCLQACDDAEDACEDAADTAWEACRAQANLDCVDFVTDRNAEIFARYSPLIADAQARTVEALAPLQACREQIAQWEAQRLSVDRALTQFRAIEERGIEVTCWSAQYDDEIEVDAEVEVAQTPSGRHVITAIGSVDNCLHDARAVPAFNLFINAALNPGVETWRPRWRTGIVRAINDDGTLKVEVTGGEMYGTLGTRVSRSTINCTPPQAYFDDGAEIDSTGEARQEYEDALQVWQSALAARDACYAAFDVAACQAPLYEVCANNLAADRLACLDVRSAGISACDGDPGCIAYVEEQYQACIALAEANAATCYQGADTQCAIDRAVAIANCDSIHAVSIREAQQLLTEAETALSNAIRMIEQPASPLILDLDPAHCSSSSYEVGDDVLIGFEDRPSSALPGGSDAAAIRAAAMAVWNTAKVYGWASNTKKCGFGTLFIVVSRGSLYREDDADLASITSALLQLREAHQDLAGVWFCDFGSSSGGVNVPPPEWEGIVSVATLPLEIEGAPISEILYEFGYSDIDTFTPTRVAILIDSSTVTEYSCPGKWDMIDDEEWFSKLNEMSGGVAEVANALQEPANGYGVWFAYDAAGSAETCGIEAPGGSGSNGIFTYSQTSYSVSRFFSASLDKLRQDIDQASGATGFQVVETTYSRSGGGWWSALGGVFPPDP